ncbi:MAG: hypothetical protein PHW13_07135 [Methylococcales bacterium]|nr:hypothetical protein [Methylococcales bacterium]
MNKTTGYVLLAAGLLYGLPGNSAELLGRISDETAVPTAQETETAPTNKPRVTYRVICSAQDEGEASPECGQPPVEDYLDLQPASRKSKNRRPQGH